MTTFEMSEKEVTMLVRALGSYLPELASERVGTDDKAWHAELKEEEAVLGELLKRLEKVAS